MISRLSEINDHQHHHNPLRASHRRRLKSSSSSAGPSPASVREMVTAFGAEEDVSPYHPHSSASITPSGSNRSHRRIVTPRGSIDCGMLSPHTLSPTPTTPSSPNTSSRLPSSYSRNSQQQKYPPHIPILSKSRSVSLPGDYEVRRNSCNGRFSTFPQVSRGSSISPSMKRSSVFGMPSRYSSHNRSHSFEQSLTEELQDFDDMEDFSHSTQRSNHPRHQVQNTKKLSPTSSRQKIGRRQNQQRSQSLSIRMPSQYPQQHHGLYSSVTNLSFEDSLREELEDFDEIVQRSSDVAGGEESTSYAYAASEEKDKKHASVSDVVVDDDLDDDDMIVATTMMMR